MKRYLQQFIYLFSLTLLLSCRVLFAASDDNTGINSYLVDDLTRYASEQQLKYLTHDDQQFIALYNDHQHAFAKGVVFVVPEIYQPVGKQVARNQWHTKLNDLGWASILITMPHRQFELAPPKPIIISAGEADESEMESTEEEESDGSEQEAENTETEAAAEQDTEESEVELSEEEQLALENQAKQAQLELLANPPVSDIRPDYVIPSFDQQAQNDVTDIMLPRIESAIELGMEHPGYFIFACEGRSCAWLTKLFNDKKLIKPDALIMLNTSVNQRDMKQQFVSQMANLEFPVLDLYQATSYPWLREHNKEKRAAARKAFKTDYRQRQLSSYVDLKLLQTRTYKEVYGFLTAMGM